MKKSITTTHPKNLLLLALMAFYAFSAAASVKIGDFYFELEGDHATLTYQNYQDSPDYESLNRVQIPSSVEYDGVSYPVTKVGDYAFYRCSNLTTLIVPSSVTSIGDWCFYYCDQLNSVRMASSVQTIGEWAFSWCKSLQTIKLPESLTSIGRAGFYGCTSLVSIDIPNSVSSLGNQTFGFCSSLESVTLPSELTSLGENTFYQCKALSSITLPSTLETIGDNCFEMCWGLQEITIPEGVKTIGKSSFNDCRNLEKLKLPSTIETIGENAFAYTALIDVYCDAAIPPQISSDTFYDSYNATLHVPQGSETLYSENENWGQFFNIEADQDSSSDPKEEPGNKPEGTDKFVLVSNADEIEEGASYVIGVTVSDTEKYTMAYDSDNKNNYVKTVEAYIEGNYLTADESTLVFTLTKNVDDQEDYWYWTVPGLQEIGLGADSGNYVVTTAPAKSLISFVDENNIVRITFPEANAKNLIVFRGGNFRHMSEGNLTNGAGYGVHLYKATNSFTSDVELNYSEDVLPAEYYTLQGVKVLNPGLGIYIKRQGTKTTKILIR